MPEDMPVMKMDLTGAEGEQLLSIEVRDIDVVGRLCRCGCVIGKV